MNNKLIRPSDEDKLNEAIEYMGSFLAKQTTYNSEFSGHIALLIKQAELFLECDLEYKEVCEAYIEMCDKNEILEDELKNLDKEINNVPNVYMGYNKRLKENNKLAKKTIEKIRQFMEYDAMVMLSAEERLEGIDEVLKEYYS